MREFYQSAMQTYKQKVPKFGKYHWPPHWHALICDLTCECSFDTEDRQSESQKIIEKYPDKVPIICEKAAKSNLPENERSK